MVKKRKEFAEKRGLSPVIATVLLVALAVVLAVIIYFWARSFSEESISKGDRDISLSCEEVSFVAEAYSNQVHIQNNGRVPIYGLEMKKKGSGEIVNVGKIDGNNLGGEPYGIGSGATGSGNLPSGVVGGDTLVLTPILLGESEEFKRAHICDEDYAVEVVVE